MFFVLYSKYMEDENDADEIIINSDDISYIKTYRTISGKKLENKCIISLKSGRSLEVNVPITDIRERLSIYDY